MDVNEIRRTTIRAMFSDEQLVDRLTLKGGNALRLVHGLGTRASIDIDLSLEQDFEDIDAISLRIFQLLQDRFDSEGYVVFDYRFERRPANSVPGDRWGGYEVEFKVISSTLFEELGGAPEQIRRQAESIGDVRQTRRFRIQISPYEYSQGRQEVEMDDYTIFVYTPEMIAIEKLRAICQQMPEYSNRRNPSARARDFYDIYQILNSGQVALDSPANLDLFHHIFAAKDVPLELLSRIVDHRKFHSIDWPAVVEAVTGEIESYDFYFDAVLSAIPKSEVFGVE